MTYKTFGLEPTSAFAFGGHCPPKRPAKAGDDVKDIAEERIVKYKRGKDVSDLSVLTST